MTQPRVRALAARTTSGYRRAWARERLRDTFWPIPGLLLAAGVALAAVTANDTRALGIPARQPGVTTRRAALLQESADQGGSQAGLVPDALGLG